MVLVDEISWLDATSLARNWEDLILKADLGLARVHESETCKSHLGAAISGNKSWCGIDHVGIVVAKSDVIIGVIKTVESDLDGQHIGLRVHWNLAANCTVSHQLGRLKYRIVGWVAEAHLHILARWILADEVSSFNGHHLAVLSLEWAERGLDASDMGRVIVDKTESGVRGSNIYPVLFVERNLDNGLGTDGLRHRNRLDSLIIVVIRGYESRWSNFLLSFRIEQTDEKLVSRSASLGVDGAIEGLESKAVDRNGCSTARWTRNRAVECNDRVLVVLEGRVWVLLVDNTLTRELLIVVGDLNGKDTRIVYLRVGDD